MTRKADTIRVRVDDHLPDPEFEVIDGIEKGMTGLGAGWSALDRMGRRMEKGMVGEGSAINATLDESIIVRAPTKSRAIALLREAISGLPYRLVFEAGDPTCRCGHPFSRHQTGEGVWTGFCYAMLEGGDLNDCKCERPEEVID